MDNEELLSKEELRELVKKVKANFKRKGIKITHEKMAISLGYVRTYFSNLMGKHGKVTVDQVSKFYYFFKEELKEEENRIKDLMMIKIFETLTPEQKDELFNKGFNDPEEKKEFQRLLNKAAKKKPE